MKAHLARQFCIPCVVLVERASLNMSVVEPVPDSPFSPISIAWATGAGTFHLPLPVGHLQYRYLFQRHTNIQLLPTLSHLPLAPVACSDPARV